MESLRISTIVVLAFGAGFLVRGAFEDSPVTVLRPLAIASDPTPRAPCGDLDGLKYLFEDTGDLLTNVNDECRMTNVE